MRIRGVGVGFDALAEVGDDIVEPDTRQDRHPVPLPLPVVRRLVAERLERQRREGVVGELGLLHAHDVGLDLAQPLLDPLEPHPQRVHVPGDESHQERPAFAAVDLVARVRFLGVAASTGWVGGAAFAARFLAGADG